MEGNKVTLQASLKANLVIILLLQRRQWGCSAGRSRPDFHHGLLAPRAWGAPEATRPPTG